MNIGMDIGRWELTPNHKVGECVPMVGTFNSTNVHGCWIYELRYSSSYIQFDERGRMPVGSPFNCKFHDIRSGVFFCKGSILRFTMHLALHMCCN
jgi:hypothetical protein